MRVYITFAEKHTHKINGVVYNNSVVAMIDAISFNDGIRLAEAHFQNNYHNVYDETAFVNSGLPTKSKIIIR